MSYLVQKGIGEFLNENHSVNSQIHDDECESSKFRTIARNHQLFLSQLIFMYLYVLHTPDVTIMADGPPQHKQEQDTGPPSKITITLMRDME